MLEAYSLLHDEEPDAFGDASYQGVQKRPTARGAVKWHVAMKPDKRRALDKSKPHDPLSERVERIKADIRTTGRAPVPNVKRQFGHPKVRYRGLRKNTAQLTTLFALSNLCVAHSKSLDAGA